MFYVDFSPGLKIRVSVFQFHPWPPSNQKLRHAESTSTVEYSVSCGMNIPQVGGDGARNYLLSNTRVAFKNHVHAAISPRIGKILILAVFGKTSNNACLLPSSMMSS